MTDSRTGMRLDKWLWCARFYKTRKLAAEAVSGGKIHLNGQRTKPGKEIHPGHRLLISKNGLNWNIEIKTLPQQRRPASEARLFYDESEESVARRHEQTAELRAIRATTPARSSGRPSKRDRRMIHRFRQDGDH